MRCSAAPWLHKLLALTCRTLGAPAVPPSQALPGCAAPASRPLQLADSWRWQPACVRLEASNMAAAACLEALRLANA